MVRMEKCIDFQKSGYGPHKISKLKKEIAIKITGRDSNTQTVIILFGQIASGEYKNYRPQHSGTTDKLNRSV